MQGRPLRTLTALDAQLREPPAVDVGEVLHQRIASRSELAGRVFGRAQALVERVRDAARKARAAAKADREG